jgi:outer membrane lipoprotein-sorting protein
MRRLLALAFSLALAAPAAAQIRLTPEDQAEVDRFEQYINAITTFRAEFTQTAPNGRQAKGVIYIQRPERLRVEFTPPADMLIVATPVWLVLYERKVKEPQYIPLRSSPAGILVRKDIKLTGGPDIRVTRVARQAGFVAVTVVDPKNPNQGSMTLNFTRAPIQLLGWTVTDAHGQTTRVEFTSYQTGIAIDPKLFLPPLSGRDNRPGSDR